MKIFLIFFLSFLSNISSSSAQKIRAAAMANDEGITQDPKKAKYLIVIKNYGDTAYERFDYNFAGPLIKKMTYMDSSLKIANGEWIEYNSAGVREASGFYTKNKKDGRWHINDTSSKVSEYQYHLDTLTAVINSDSLAREKAKLKKDTTLETEAVYVGGTKKMTKIIQSNIKIPDRTAILTKGGTVLVSFVIDTLGKTTNIEILKSVEFAFDEEAKRLVSLLTDWIPATNGGKKIRAFRIQPITIKLD